MRFDSRRFGSIQRFNGETASMGRCFLGARAQRLSGHHRQGQAVSGNGAATTARSAVGMSRMLCTSGGEVL